MGSTETKSTPIHTVAFHVGPHLEEATGYALLQALGREMFPGIETAKLAFWGHGGKTPDGRSAALWEAEGTLAIGTGRGRFDEHATETEGRKEGESSLSLIAKALGIDDEPWLEKVLAVVTDEDLYASSGMLSIATILKMKHAQSPENAVENMEWAIEGVGAIIKNQMLFYKQTAAEWNTNAHVVYVTGPHGVRLPIASIVSNNPQIAKYARSKHGGNVGVVIVKTSTGNVQILPNHEFNLNMSDTVSIIRYEEQRKRGRFLTTRWPDLVKEGIVPGAECWYFQRNGWMILNGSLSNPNVEPTKLSLEEILEIVKIGVSPRSFLPIRQSTCTENKCTSSRQNPCPWYDWGMQRCKKARFYQNNPQAATNAA